MIFAGYTGSKNPVRNRLKIQFVELDFSKLIFQKSSTDQQGVWFAKLVLTLNQATTICLFWEEWEISNELSEIKREMK